MRSTIFVILIATVLAGCARSAYELQAKLDDLEVARMELEERCASDGCKADWWACRNWPASKKYKAEMLEQCNAEMAEIDAAALVAAKEWSSKVSVTNTRVDSEALHREEAERVYKRHCATLIHSADDEAVVYAMGEMSYHEQEKCMDEYHRPADIKGEDYDSLCAAMIYGTGEAAIYAMGKMSYHEKGKCLREYHRLD